MREFDYSAIPEHCRGGVQRYIEHGVPTGDFLQAVFENNLVEAFGRADNVNQTRLRDYCRFLYNQAPKSPVPCWGSPEAYKNWIKIGGVQGLMKQQA